MVALEENLTRNCMKIRGEKNADFREAVFKLLFACACEKKRFFCIFARKRQNCAVFVLGAADKTRLI